MKRYFNLFISIGLCLLLFTSCLDKYLDVSPESGLTEKEVFSKYENARKFFDYVYLDRGPASISTSFKLCWSMSTQKFSLESLTDMSDTGRRQTAQPFKAGNIFPNITLIDWADGKFTFGFFAPMCKATRIANITLEKIDEIQDISKIDYYDLKAQAFFVRGFCLFEVFRGWGAMPHITKALGPDDLWDIPRPSKHETCMNAAADLDSAAFYFEKAGLMRRDPGPGITGHLNNPNQNKPNGVAAKAIRARVLLYAASPLNNELGTKDWEDAAIANSDAIKTAEQYSYALLSAADYKKNYVGVKYSNEQLYGWNGGTYTQGSQFLQFLIPSVLKNSTSSTNSSEDPTQNTVDKYETIYGEPLLTAADRDAATALGHYNEQDPYANRDPRFKISVLYNQAPLVGWGGTPATNKAEIWIQNVGGTMVKSELLNTSFLGTTLTGYYQIKRWGGESSKNTSAGYYTDPVIRLTELYLNYAEAANEAYGPNVPAPGATMTAVDAINVVRARIGMPPVLSRFTTDKDTFRPRIKNERTIELAFEGHYFYDIRRWKDAPAIYQTTLYGMVVEKVPVSTTYPTGFKYSRAPIPADRQMSWREAMYYFPFTSGDYDKMKNFVATDKW